MRMKKKRMKPPFTPFIDFWSFHLEVYDVGEMAL